MKALNACYAEIDHTRPGLVVVMGDLSFPLGIMSIKLYPGKWTTLKIKVVLPLTRGTLHNELLQARQ